MAQDLRSKKVQFCLHCVDLADDTLRLLRELNELIANYNDNTFGVGQANAITDADLDFTTSTIKHLTPQLISDFITAAQAVTTISPVNRAAIRRVVQNPVRPIT